MLKSLRELQKEAILAMLNLNAQPATDGSVVWKVLIYDRLGQQVISPLLKVNELREQGITVHMGLGKERLPIPDVPAVYFVQPTLENVKIIAQDLSRHLYDAYYINSSNVIPRPVLEELASLTLDSNSSHLVAQVYDQYLDYVCLEDNLFSMQLSDSYFLINDANSTESLIEGLTTQIASSLFSVIVTLGVVPIIRCQRGSVAEALATKLDARLRDYVLNSRQSLQLDMAGAQLSRPVLVLLDRMMDLSTMLSHTWTYSTLVHDVLDMNLNRVTVAVDGKGSQIYDVDSSDAFWKKNAGNPFPQVAEEVDTEINKYKQDVDQVTKACGVNSIEEMDPNSFGSGTKGLNQALNKLPELTLRKKSLDMHMNIATALFKHIQERQLDSFFSMEESIGKLTKANLLETIRDPSKQPLDKIRLFIIYYLSHEEVSKDDLGEYERALTEAGCDTSVINYIKQVRMYNKMANISQTPDTRSAGQTSDFFSSIGTKISDQLQSSGVSNKFESLISSVKNMLPLRKDLPVTTIMETLMEPGHPESEDYLYFDPKVSKAAAAKVNKTKLQFSDGIVFMIGGGNYLEYQNLMEFAVRNNMQKKRIIYGSTELLTAKVFLEQLEKLGKTR